MNSLMPNYPKARLTALIGAMILHCSVAAWALQPAGPQVIPEQVLQVTMVAPSAPNVEKHEEAAAGPEPTPVAPPEPDGLKKMQPKHEESKKKIKKEEKPKEEQKQSKGNPTTGMQSPDALQTKSAETDPVYNAAYLHNPAPAYPDSARRKGAQGTVLLKCRVKPDGMPETVEISHSSGFAALDQAAIEAVKQWKFIPARRGSEVVEASVIVPVDFKLN